MLTCIACSKHLEDSVDEDGTGTVGTKAPAVKSLATQIKEIALKLSGTYRQCKPSTSSSSSSSYRRGAGNHYNDFDVTSEGLNYGFQKATSTHSTPAWEFHSSKSRVGVKNHSSTSAGDIAGLDSVSSRCGELILEDDEEPREWMAQVEPGVLITFLSLPHGGNDLKRIRFSREMFNKVQALKWWGENYDRVMELYNVQRFSRQAITLPTPPRSEEEASSVGTLHDNAAAAAATPARNTNHNDHQQPARNFYRLQGKPYFPTEPPATSDHGDGTRSRYDTALVSSNYSSPHVCNHHELVGAGKNEVVSLMDAASRTTTSSIDEGGSAASMSNASDMMENEWVEEDEPGVYITIRALPDGTRELRRVRFSRERFGEINAKMWWEENRERIQAQYL